MPADPPIGRIGYVLDGLGTGRSASGASVEVRCNHCGSWFPKREHWCTHCEHPRPGFSKAIRTAQLNHQLFVQAGLRKPDRYG